MSPQNFDFLYELIQTASPTGSEQVIQRKIYEQYKDVAETLEPDVHGNLLLGLNPKKRPRVLLAGHCDQIGFIVRYISPDGYIYIDPIGGTDSGVLLGEHLWIQTREGMIEGVVGRKPKHFQEESEKNTIPDQNKIWVDIGARSGDEVRELVELGNYATFPLRITKLRDNKISAPALDNKAGLFVCLEVLRRCAKRGCEAGLFVASTVQEEIGSRGAATATSKLSPDVGIAVDTIPATDDPGCDLPPQQFVPCRLAHGPTIAMGPSTNPVVGKMLIDIAAKRKLPFQVDPSGGTIANDSRMIQIADSGVAAASVSIPQRNMHTQVEIVSLQDLESSIELLTEFVCQVKEDSDFRPFFFKGQG